ncbi:MAG: enhanced serine sensitivity protein SseB [Clostridiales bacterium]|nr:enhanced serine sensitivity protein SseB [Clostridiales bacterium]
MSTNLENFRSGIEGSLKSLGSEPTPEILKDFFFALQEAEFIVPANFEGKELATVAAERADGILVLIPIFTCEEELNKLLPEGCVPEIFSYSTLKHLIIDDLRLDGLVINPFGRHLILNRERIEEIDSATTGVSLSRLKNPGRLTIKSTGDYLQELVDAICAVVEGRPEVYRVYIVSAIREGDSSEHLMLVFDFDGHETQLFPAIAEAIRPHLGERKNFELIKANLALLRMVDAAGARPVYVK